jgi:nucleotide-binding universal stress UspA family protein
MKTILAAVDFSDATAAVVRAAAEMARAVEGKLFILHVAAPDPAFVGFEAGPQTVRDAQARHYHEEHGKLRAIEENLKQEGLDAEVLLVQGPTAEKILAEAARLDARIIVLGSHGHGGLHYLLMGSVAEAVLRKAHGPVVVVPVRPRPTA